MMSLTINLISRIYYSCERRKYLFMVLRKYLIIFRKGEKKGKNKEINGEAIQPFAQRKKRSPSK